MPLHQPGNDLLERINGLITSYRSTNDFDFKQLEEAISLCRQHLGVVDSSPNQLAFLGSLLWLRYRANGSDEDLKESSRIGLEAARSMARDDPQRQGVLFNTLSILSEICKSAGATDNLDELCWIGIEVAQSLGLDDPARPAILRNLRADIGKKFERAKTLSDLEDVIAVGKEYARTDGGLSALCELRAMWYQKYETTREPKDLDEAILVAQDAVKEGTRTSTHLSELLNNLGILLSDKYTHTRVLKDLEDAICNAREALKTTIDADPNQAMYHYNLSMMLLKRYERQSATEDLDEAATLSKIAVSGTSNGHAERSNRLNHCGSCFSAKYEATSSLDYLDTSIRYCQKAVDEALPAARASALNSLSTSLSQRFKRLGTVEDLKAAIGYSREAVCQMEALGRDDPYILSTLANQLCRKYSRSGDLTDLGQAINAARRTLDATPPDHGDRVHYLSNLGAMLGMRYDREKIRSDIDEAIERVGEASGALPAGDPVRLLLLSNLGLWLIQRHEGTGRVDDLNEAIQFGREAVSKMAPSDHRLGHVSFNLARALGFRGKGKGKGGETSQDLEDALLHYTNVAQNDLTAPLKRIEASRAAADLHISRSDWPAAYKLLAGAIGLLPKVYIRGLLWDDRQYVLRGMSGLSSLAACAALNAGIMPPEALALLEAGRGIIASSVIDSRSSFSALEKASPALYQEYMEKRELASFSMSKPESQWGKADDVSLRNRAIRVLELLEEQIREQTALQTFGLSLAPSGLIQLAESGSIVSFNVTEHRSDAFLVSNRDITVLSLAELHFSDLLHRVEDMDKITSARDTATYPNRNKKLRAHLKWLWEVAVRPVLVALDLLRTTATTPGRLPRLWWVTSGPVGHTPLHAAGSGWGQSTENTASHVVSSYIPTFKALASAREISLAMRGWQECGIQIVAMPKTTGFEDLSTAGEVEGIQRSVKECDVLETPDKESVLDSMRCRPIMHFACHGESDPEDPSNSYLALRDGPDGTPQRLSVREVADVSLPEAYMAYLSACSTARHRAPDLRDEAIHIASAFQLVGFRHVLATLWIAHDLTAVDIATLFYKELAQALPSGFEGAVVKSDHDQVAYAHHHAVQLLREGALLPIWARRTSPENVISWATFVHFGC
ncbi:CHAT domain-containing protein [Ilyonectria robusta]|uniref:CHAT domain-containing protein n=1 Tax=Ilyonectria robusta TaxID=1079257 RepID=UPI001E8E37F2|nr:CHAT domain-containing protein [Ilyonectria robusta]KAH8645867.1 CHAT domain-containing protein [Ilyonectria robusta]